MTGRSRKNWQRKSRKIENEYQKTEQEIEALETDIANLDEELMRPEYACNAHKLNELSTARRRKRNRSHCRYGAMGTVSRTIRRI